MAAEHNTLFTLIMGPYYSWLFIILLLLMQSMDYVSGIAAAIYEKTLSSKVGFKGMMKKSGMLLIVATAYLFELQIFTLPENLRPGMMLPLSKIVAAYFFAVEALSVLENCKRCGVPLPAFLSKSLIDTMARLSQFNQPQEKTKVETTTVITHEPQAPTPPPLVENLTEKPQP